MGWRKVLLGTVVLVLLSGALVATAVLAPQFPPTWGIRRALVRAYRSTQHRSVKGPHRGERILVKASRLRADRRAIRRAIGDSRAHGRYHLVVDKTAYTLLVYLDGALVRSFPVELGFDPAEPKLRQGDGRTPEGRYTVVWRRRAGATRFHRALLLDYPNRRDRRAGRTGGDIEIHGKGSGARPGEGGVNWTLGCIALSDRDVEALFALRAGARKIGKGTPVTIVHCGTLPGDRYEIEP
ncbi:MAG: L,D-transpeptidase family protein [Acidobacteria bacterium]|nr:L,D-transpeptidase family protein [Acidobacteriota bacterium]